MWLSSFIGAASIYLKNVISHIGCCDAVTFISRFNRRVHDFLCHTAIQRYHRDSLAQNHNLHNRLCLIPPIKASALASPLSSDKFHDRQRYPAARRSRQNKNTRIIARDFEGCLEEKQGASQSQTKHLLRDKDGVDHPNVSAGQWIALL